MSQPPSGGCVLKLSWRFCTGSGGLQPPSGGCVLKQAEVISTLAAHCPAAFRRLCVETKPIPVWVALILPSRLQAAVC